MHLTLIRARENQPLTLVRSGDALIFNGTTFDFRPLPEGGLLFRAAINCYWIRSDVYRLSGSLHMTILAPHASGDLPEDLWHPAPIINPPDGLVALPAFDWRQE